MAKKKDTTIKEKTVAQDKKRATRKKKDATAVVENTQQETAEKVKASPIKKTINTEKPKTVKEIVSTRVKEKKIVEKQASVNVDTNKEQPVVPTHIGGVKLSDRLVNLLRRQASNK